MAETAFTGKSEAEPFTGSPVTLPPHQASELKQRLARQKASLHLYGFFHPKSLADFPSTEGQAPEPQLMLNWALHSS